MRLARNFGWVGRRKTARRGVRQQQCGPIRSSYAVLHVSCRDQTPSDSDAWLRRLDGTTKPLEGKDSPRAVILHHNWCNKPERRF